MQPAQLASLVASTFTLATAAYAAGLDDPGGVPGATVRTEIRRGAREAAACGLKAGSDNVKLADCIYRAHVDSLSRDAATAPFTLGLFFDGWLHATASPDLNTRLSAERVVPDFYSIANHHARGYRLDVEAVCLAADQSCDLVNPKWKEWEAVGSEGRKTSAHQVEPPSPSGPVQDREELVSPRISEIQRADLLAATGAGVLGAGLALLAPERLAGYV